MPRFSFADATQSSLKFLKHLTTVRPTEPKLTIGVDIGSSEVKVVGLGRRRGLGSRTLIGQSRESLGEQPESHAGEAIKRALSSLGLPPGPVSLAVSGQWVMMRVVEMPKLAPDELAQALPFEAQRYVPFNIQDVVLDGAVLGPAEANKLWVLFVVCKRELLERRIGWIRQAGCEPAVIDVDALALANAFVEQAGSKRLSGTNALINVGTQWTNLVVLKAEAPFLVRDIPWGAVKLVRHMAEQLGREEQAILSQLKANPVPTEIVEAMRVSCEALAVELQLSFDFFESHFGPPPDQILVSGGLSQFPGFVEGLKTHLTQPLATWAPGLGLTGEFAVAYGLALRSTVAAG